MCGGLPTTAWWCVRNGKRNMLANAVQATASGDQTVGLTDVQTQKAVARLVGHLSSVKQVAFDPTNTNILATASRDGSIRIWDIRESCKGAREHDALHDRR
jgi:WD40 repeat protein